VSLLAEFPLYQTVLILVALAAIALLVWLCWRYSSPERTIARRARRHQCAVCGHQLPDPRTEICPHCGLPVKGSPK
jgi:hypothetical protein